jgi:hypothetical protein
MERRKPRNDLVVGAASGGSKSVQVRSGVHYFFEGWGCQNRNVTWRQEKGQTTFLLLLLLLLLLVLIAFD